MMLSASLAWPGNEPLLIGRPDPVFLDRGLERDLLVLGIDAADGGCWRRFEAVDFPGRRVLAAGFFGLRISPSTQCNSRRPRAAGVSGTALTGWGEPARRLVWKIVFCGTHLDTAGCHILTAARGRAQIMMVPRRAMMRSHS